MSKVKLEQILEEIGSRTSKEYRAKVGNYLPTELYVSPELIEEQLISEILFTSPTKKGQIPKRLKDALDKLVTECYENIKKTALSRVGGSIDSVEPYGTSGIIIRADGNRDNFKAVYTITAEATRLLRNRVNLILKASSLEILPSNIFDIGHEGGSNVEIQIGQSLAGKLNDPALQRFLASSRLSEIQATLSIASKFNAGGDKSYVVKGILEAKGPNRGKAEAAYKKIFVEELEAFVKTNDWVNQESSDSVMQNIENSLVNIALEAGAKGTKRKQNTAPSTATVTNTIVGKKAQQVGFSPELSDLRVAQARDLTSLIPLLNAKLPPAVRSNMTGGALHNKSGRFSESVRIASISQTPQGYPRLNYTYQRSPYDVFDPVLGRSPWKTPGRDPKTLISKSIRDIAKDIVTGRFYTARA